MKAGGRRCPADHLLRPPRHLLAALRQRLYADDQQHVQRGADGRRLARQVISTCAAAIATGAGGRQKTEVRAQRSVGLSSFERETTSSNPVRSSGESVTHRNSSVEVEKRP